MPTVAVDATFPLGPVRGTLPDVRLDPEQDYFAYHSHLRLYLYRNCGGILFDDLDSDENHRRFSSFVKAYNAGELPETYYLTPLPEAALEECGRTRHQWTFKTSREERDALDSVKRGVKKQTEYHVTNAPGTCRVAKPERKMTVAPR